MHREGLDVMGDAHFCSRHSHTPVPNWKEASSKFEFLLSLKIHVVRHLLMHHSEIWGSFVAPFVSPASQRMRTTKTRPVLPAKILYLLSQAQDDMWHVVAGRGTIDMRNHRGASV